MEWTRSCASGMCHKVTVRSDIVNKGSLRMGSQEFSEIVGCVMWIGSVGFERVREPIDHLHT